MAKSKSKKITISFIDNDGKKHNINGLIRANGFLEFDGLNDVDKLAVEAFKKVECQAEVFFSWNQQLTSNTLYNHLVLGLDRNIYQPYIPFGIN